RGRRQQAAARPQVRRGRGQVQAGDRRGQCRVLASARQRQARTGRASERVVRGSDLTVRGGMVPPRTTRCWMNPAESRTTGGICVVEHDPQSNSCNEPEPYLPVSVSDEELKALSDLQKPRQSIEAIRREINAHGEDPLEVAQRAMKENRILGLGEWHWG